MSRSVPLPAAAPSVRAPWTIVFTDATGTRRSAMLPARSSAAIVFAGGLGGGLSRLDVALIRRVEVTFHDRSEARTKPGL